jgi:hypothetical protein
MGYFVGPEGAIICWLHGPKPAKFVGKHALVGSWPIRSFPHWVRKQSRCVFPFSCFPAEAELFLTARFFTITIAEWTNTIKNSLTIRLEHMDLTVIRPESVAKKFKLTRECESGGLPLQL